MNVKSKVKKIGVRKVYYCETNQESWNIFIKNMESVLVKGSYVRKEKKFIHLYLREGRMTKGNKVDGGTCKMYVILNDCSASEESVIVGGSSSTSSSSLNKRTKDNFSGSGKGKIGNGESVNYIVLGKHLVRCGRNFIDNIMKTKQYTKRQTCEISDFVIKTGNVNLGKELKGFIFDIEMKRSNEMNMSNDKIFIAFVRKLFAVERIPENLKSEMRSIEELKSPNIICASLEYNEFNLSNQEYTSQHTPLQYIALMKCAKLL